jgi:hypothetical protein
MEYRVYFLNNEDRVSSFLAIVCESDAGAIEQAKQFVNGQDVELWQRGRLVIRLFSRDLWQSPLGANSFSKGGAGPCDASQFTTT